MFGQEPSQQPAQQYRGAPAAGSSNGTAGTTATTNTGFANADVAVQVMNEAVRAESCDQDLPFALKRYKDAVSLLSAVLVTDGPRMSRHYQHQLSAYLEQVKRKVVQLEQQGVVPSATASPKPSSKTRRNAPTGPPRSGTITGTAAPSGGQSPSSSAPNSATKRKPVTVVVAGQQPGGGNKQGSSGSSSNPSSKMGSRQASSANLFMEPCGPPARPGTSTSSASPPRYLVRRSVSPATPQSSGPLSSGVIPGSSTSLWSASEGGAVQQRLTGAAQALHAALGGGSTIGGAGVGYQPKIGLCLSGGGWRAMTSACALLDGLAIPLSATSPSSSTGSSRSIANAAGSVKPLDFFSYAFGLSGGSWVLANALLGASNGRRGPNAVSNPYHSCIHNDNPWLFGPQHHFDIRKHRYEGLVHMMDGEKVDEACHRTDFRRNVGFVATRIGADATIASVLTTKELGPTLVERWANFLGNDLLSWKDDGFTPSSKDIEKRVDSQIKKVRSIEMAKIAAEVKKNNLSAAAAQKMQERLLGDESVQRQLIADSKRPSRNVTLSALSNPILSGELPFIVCTAIANKEKSGNATTGSGGAPLAQSTYPASPAAPRHVDPLSLSAPPTAADSGQQEERKKRFPRIYDWIEFSPFFVRNCATGTYYPTPDELQGTFADKDDPKQLYLHHVLGICGSAFACDISSAMPVGMQRKMSRSVELPRNPLIGRGTSHVSSAKMSGPPLGECRDAGIDINVPLPAMSKEAGRDFDIIVVHDAGSGSANAHELQRAIDLGYFAPVHINAEELFQKGQYVRVYRPLVGNGPIVIYFLGLVERGTHHVIYPKERLLSDTTKVRDRVVKQLVPCLIAEIAAFHRRRDRRASQASPMTPPDAHGTRSRGEGPATHVPRGLTNMPSEQQFMPVGDYEEDIEDDEDIVPDGELLHQDVRTIMLAAAATGSVNNDFDAFVAAEKVIFAANSSTAMPYYGQGRLAEGQYEKDCNTTLFILEAASVMSLFADGSVQATGQQDQYMNQNRLDSIPKALKKELLHYEIIMHQVSAHARAPLFISPPWAAHFAAVALASQLARASNCKPALEVLRRGQVPPSCTASLSNVPLFVSSSVWARLSLCVRQLADTVQGGDRILQFFVSELFKNFESFLAAKAKYSDYHREVALRNFALALTDCGLNMELIGLVEKYAVTPGERTKVAETAARCGNLTVLKHMVKYPKSLDQQSVLAAGYGSTNPEVVAWLKSTRKLSLNFLEAVKNGYVEAVIELGRLPPNMDSQEAGTLAIKHQQQRVANALYNQGSAPYRRWLAAAVKANSLTDWSYILSRAEAVEERNQLVMMDRQHSSSEDFIEKFQTFSHSAQEKYEVVATTVAAKKETAAEVAQNARDKLRRGMHVMRAFWKK